MPWITRDFPGVLPWYFGGDPWFTYEEAEAYRKAELELNDARLQRKREQDQRRPSPAPRARRPRRRR